LHGFVLLLFLSTFYALFFLISTLNVGKREV